MKPIKWLDEPAPCRKCGMPCVTVKIGGRMPMHLSCDPRYWLSPTLATREELVEAMHVLADALGPLVRDPPAPPARARELGPCRRCGARTRLYGPWGRALCPDCEKGSTTP